MKRIVKITALVLVLLLAAAAAGILALWHNVLASVGRRSWNHNSSEHLTIHSAIYNLTDKTVDWVPNENYHDPEAWFTFAL